LPASCSNVELSYWTPFTGPDQPFMQQLVDSFNSENPNILVTMVAQAEYNTQLSTAAAADQLPDVAIINEDQVATQAFRNVIRPIDDVIDQMGLSASDFPEVAWNAGTIAGKQYAVPLSFVAMTLYYNEDLLKAAGLSAPPTNDEEFQAAAQAMTSGDNKGFMITTGFPVQQIFQQLLHQFGGTEFNEDGTEATWNSEAGVQALQWMVDAQRNFSEPNLEVDADLNAFKSGTTGMIMNGSWQIPNLTGDAVGFAGKLAPVPQIGDQPAVWAGGPLLTLPVHQSGNDECKDAAAAMLIRYLVENSAEWAKGGNVPAYNPAREDPTFTALPQAVLAESVENPVFPPAIPGVGDAFTPLSEAITAVMGGNATDIKAALDDAANRANQILAENKANYGDAPQGQ
jgi:multiple sugar transport system substrate-binding protein